MGNITLERIEKLLKENKLTGSLMCDTIGLSRGFMTELRKGRTRNISTENAKKIADFFGVTTDYLLGNDSKSNIEYARKACVLDKDRLKGMREKSHLSPAQLAIQAGISKSQYISYEDGSERPSPELLNAIAKELEVTGDYLLGLTDFPFDDSKPLADDKGRALTVLRGDDGLFYVKEDKEQKEKAPETGDLESDPLLAFYGDVKEHLSQDDLDDIKTIMEAKAKRNKEKKKDESGRKNL